MTPRLGKEPIVIGPLLRPKEETEALATELAEMKVECNHGKAPLVYSGEGPTLEGCEACHPSGMVFLLDDSVRVPCRSSGAHDLGLSCPCGGRGWTAPCRREDFVTWCNALQRAEHDILPHWWGTNVYITFTVCVMYVPRGRNASDGKQYNLDAQRLLTALAQLGKEE